MNIAPALSHKAVTPSDSTDLTSVGASGIYVLTSGNLVLQGLGGVSVTYPVVAGQFLAFRPTRVMAASTATCVLWR